MQDYYVLLQYAITSFRELLRITAITTITTRYFPGQPGDEERQVQHQDFHSVTSHVLSIMLSDVHVVEV